MNVIWLRYFANLCFIDWFQKKRNRFLSTTIYPTERCFLPLPSSSSGQQNSLAYGCPLPLNWLVFLLPASVFFFWHCGGPLDHSFLSSRVSWLPSEKNMHQQTPTNAREISTNFYTFYTFYVVFIVTVAVRVRYMGKVSRIPIRCRQRLGTWLRYLPVLVGCCLLLLCACLPAACCSVSPWFSQTHTPSSCHQRCSFAPVYIIDGGWSGSTMWGWRGRGSLNDWFGSGCLVGLLAEAFNKLLT